MRRTRFKGTASQAGAEGIDPGRPGASARAEFERRRRRDTQRRRQRFGRLLAPLVRALAGELPSTAAWDRGGRGEERVGLFLSRAVGRRGAVLHDRTIAGTRANIDHIAIVASGVWVIDTKQYRGRIARHRSRGWFGGRPALFVNGHDRSHLVTAARRQAALVQHVVGPHVAVHPVLCFADAEWGRPGQPFTLDGVLVTRPRCLRRSLGRAGPYAGPVIGELASRVGHAFPIYAPSGTSHRPTGA
jgi:hypothetical protein